MISLLHVLTISDNSVCINSSVIFQMLNSTKE